MFTAEQANEMLKARSEAAMADIFDTIKHTASSGQAGVYIDLTTEQQSQLQLAGYTIVGGYVSW